MKKLYYWKKKELNENKEDQTEIKNESVGYGQLNPWWDFIGIDILGTQTKKNGRKGQFESLKCCGRLWVRNNLSWNLVLEFLCISW